MIKSAGFLLLVLAVGIFIYVDRIGVPMVGRMEREYNAANAGVLKPVVRNLKGMNDRDQKRINEMIDFNKRLSSGGVLCLILAGCILIVGLFGRES